MLVLTNRIQQVWFTLRVDPGMVVLVLVFLVLLPLSMPRIYATDEVQYYVYARSLYFDGDLDFSNDYYFFATEGMKHDDPAIYNALLRHRDDDPPVNPITGLLRNVAPIGSALLWLPAIILADGGVRLFNAMGGTIPADGFSWPYIHAACYMSALAALAGLLLTYRLARRWSGVVAATLATVTVWLASPLVFYTYIAMPLSHAPAFFLFALFLTIWLHGDQRPLIERLAQRPWYQWMLLGLVGGWMTITREQLGLLLLIPAVEGLIAYGLLVRAWWQPQTGQSQMEIEPWPGLRQLFVGHAVFLGSFGLMLLPQLMTYQILNGRPMPATIVSGKLEASGGISPHFFDTLIDPTHGAFFWSPILFLGLVGLYWLARSDWLLAGLLLLGFVGQTYLNGSFGTTWHLSGAFGFRRLLECTPIFVLGLAALFAWLQQRVGYVPLILLALACIYWNAGLIAQWTVVRTPLRMGLIWDDMFRYQFVEVPRQVVGRLSDLLFHRCRLVQNQQC
ncbi:MAG: hypothetical protein HC837_06875 [Chloroflexaceae bacterium]|nr:hypothetical protein [Chloroflexaceae bacterium]